MHDCCNGHRTDIQVVVYGADGSTVANSSTMSDSEVEAVINCVQEGDCPVCSGLMR